MPQFTYRNTLKTIRISERNSQKFKLIDIYAILDHFKIAIWTFIFIKISCKNYLFKFLCYPVKFVFLGKNLTEIKKYMFETVLGPEVYKFD